MKRAVSDSWKDSESPPRAIPGEGSPGGFVGGEAEREGPVYSSLFLIAFVVLFVAWLLGGFVFHVAGGLIHVLLVVAIIVLIVHFVRGRP
jgi:hypothetical protein